VCPTHRFPCAFGARNHLVLRCWSRTAVLTGQADRGPTLTPRAERWLSRNSSTSISSRLRAASAVEAIRALRRDTCWLRTCHSVTRRSDGRVREVSMNNVSRRGHDWTRRSLGADGSDSQSTRCPVSSTGPDGLCGIAHPGQPDKNHSYALGRLICLWTVSTFCIVVSISAGLQRYDVYDARARVLRGGQRHVTSV